MPEATVMNNWEARYQELLAREADRPGLVRELERSVAEGSRWSKRKSSLSEIRAVMPAMDKRFALVMDNKGEMHQLTRRELQRINPEALKSLLEELNEREEEQNETNDEYLSQRWKELLESHTLTGEELPKVERKELLRQEEVEGEVSGDITWEKAYRQLAAESSPVNDFLRMVYEKHVTEGMLRRYHWRQEGRENEIKYGFESIKDNLPSEEMRRESFVRAQKLFDEEWKRLGTGKLAATYVNDEVAYYLADQNPELSRAFAWATYEFCKEMIMERCPHRILEDGSIDGMEVPSENIEDYVYPNFQVQEELEKRFAGMNPALMVKFLDGQRFGNVILAPYLDHSYVRADEFRDVVRIRQEVVDRREYMEQRIEQALTEIMKAVTIEPGETLDEQIAFVDLISEAIHRFVNYDKPAGDRAHNTVARDQYRQLMMWGSAVNHSEVCRSYVQLACEIIRRKTGGRIRTEDLSVGSNGEPSNHLAFAAIFDVKPGEKSKIVPNLHNKEPIEVALIWDPTWGTNPDEKGEQNGPGHMGVEEFESHGEREAEYTLVDIGYYIRLPLPESLVPRLHQTGKNN